MNAYTAERFDLDYLMPIRAPRQGLAAFEQEFAAAYKYGGIWITLSA